MVRPVAHHRAPGALRFVRAHERAQLRRVLRRRGMAHAGDGGHLARRGEAPRPRHGDGLAHDRVPPRDHRGQLALVRGAYTKVGTKSFGYELRLYESDSMTHCATEKAVEVCFDTQARKGVALPEDLKAKLTAVTS